MKKINQMKLVGMGMVLLSASISTAGVGSHGGQGVACANPSGQIISVEMYDYYEGANYLSTLGQLDMGNPSAPYQDQITYVLNRLAKIDPIASSRFQERAKNFESRILWLDDAQMVSLSNDAHHVVNPDNGCYTDQFAVQYFEFREGQTKRYSVNKDLWVAASETAKAGLVLHEVIYQDAVEGFKQENSDSTRYYNYAISSSVMNNISPTKYLAILNSAGFNQPTAVGSYLFSTNQFGFTTFTSKDFGTFFNADISPVLMKIGGTEMFIDSIKLNPKTGQVTNVYQARAACDKQNGLVHVPSDGPTITVPIPAGFNCDLGYTATIPMLINGVNAPIYAFYPSSDAIAPFWQNHGIQINSSGAATLGVLVSDVDILVQGQNVRLFANRQTTPLAGAFDTETWNDGSLKMGKISGGVSFQTDKGTTVNLSGGVFGKKAYFVNFDENGKLIGSRAVPR